MKHLAKWHRDLLGWCFGIYFARYLALFSVVEMSAYYAPRTTSHLKLTPNTERIKVNVTSEVATKAQRLSRCIPLLFL